jgi:ribonuclease BN (tRNA processing enzyme)
MSKYKIITFGTVGWIPTVTRETPCVCVDLGDNLFIFDAGTGISNFSSKIGLELLSKHKEIHLFLSHFHLDHIIGLSYLPFFFKDKNLYLYGPGRNITGLSVFDTLDGLFKKPLFPLSLNKFPLSLEVKDLGLGETLIGNHKIEIIVQEHSDPSIGIRLNDAVTYITDTSCNERTIEFARDSKVLIHEAWFDDADYRKLETNKDEPVLKVHSYSSGVAEIAKKAGVELLAMVHLNPAYAEERYKNMLDETKEIFANTIIPNDLDIINTQNLE